MTSKPVLSTQKLPTKPPPRDRVLIPPRRSSAASTTELATTRATKRSATSRRSLQTDLEAPQNLAAIPGENVTLSWEPVAEAEGYNIFRNGRYQSTVAAMPTFVRQNPVFANGGAADDGAWVQTYTEKVEPGVYDYYVIASTERPILMPCADAGPKYSEPSDAITVWVGESRSARQLGRGQLRSVA